ncbi:hypothetical protein BLNAU_4902 [Blattamonas nauphoetae]|uniref:Uncharacterized protein n=1 Tax=Blattamonas nauphoetae TaxID=2049346 RepID=A0ABQ9Y8N1_9EUKA|nr:hypothetical protein BLNAU_4902 [Blattamonas nauphoetae]
MENDSESSTTSSETYLNRLPNRHSTVDYLHHPFLVFDENSVLSFLDKSRFYRSLVALVKADYPFDNALQDKAVQFLKNLTPIGYETGYSAKLVTELVPSSAGSLSGFVESIITLLSSHCSTVVETAFSFVYLTLFDSSLTVRCRLMESGLISKALATVQPHTLPIAANKTLIDKFVWTFFYCINLALPTSLSELGITAAADQFNHREMILQEVVLPSSQFMTFLISNQPILNRDLFQSFMYLLISYLRLGPFHRPTLEFVLASPIVMGFSSYLSFVEHGYFLCETLVNLHNSLKLWKKEGPEVAESGKRMIKALFSEGFEVTLEQMVMQNKDGDYGHRLTVYCLDVSELLGSNQEFTEV